MKGMIWYLDALRAHFGVQSDYALAKALGITRASVSQYRNGHATFSDDLAFKVADILGARRGAVWLDMQAERATRSQNEPLSAALDELRHLGGKAA